MIGVLMVEGYKLLVNVMIIILGIGGIFVGLVGVYNVNIVGLMIVICLFE